MKYNFIFTFIFILQVTLVEAQSGSETYRHGEDPIVYENLKKWQNDKFGILIHFGLYSEIGTVESWGLCPEDWVTRPGYEDYCTYANEYRNTKAKLNPKNFDPQRWAKAIKASGAKYMIFTTKHHDGFCMFDSKYSDFKITDKNCPFSLNPKANVAKEIFESFRKEGLSVGAYFSKPDWTTPYFWWPAYPPKDRNPNYDINKCPDRWKKFVEFTQNQIKELVTEYGKLDILWLDGCWIRPLATINKKVEEFCKYPYDLDIDMKTISAFAHEKQPGMLIVDRWVQGEYENYLTPEQKIPEKALAVPWESCITMGDKWGWVPNDKYKPARELIQLLVKIVAKGGNLLLGFGPDGKGDLNPIIYERLKEMGQWLETNGEAIYGIVPVEPFQEGKIAYTKKENIIYAIYLPDIDEKELPEELLVKTGLKGKLIISLPAFKQIIYGIPIDDGIKISIPESLRKILVNQAAFVIKISN